LKIGIIGTGNMGTILISSLIDGFAAPPSAFFVTNRTLEKTVPLKETYPDLTVVDGAEVVVSNADLIFLCVKPHQIYPLLDSLKSSLNENKFVVSITSPVAVNQLEHVLTGPCARVIPSITNRALSGTTLITFGKRCTTDQKMSLTSLLSKISVPIEIEEKVTRVASDISSCGPAFISYILERMIEAAVNVTAISEEQATELVTQMMVGYGQLFMKDFYTLETLRKKVNVKGGVTGEGLKILEDELGPLFEHLFEKTQVKFTEDHKTVDKQFGVGAED
jgi:competence protein ComER